ncbi:hypothetical protein BT96DRAFT_960007 [Gymnopus androsaceus JB14]|uniref:Uncharacterized protein n=1 Tax=Gymnopus androsaceus JB14 TaxID=1447944 RepID=A0A6A4GVQ7_9AGAR|nr:hypothetical protein BT96DRAFT_960007 [Gymnopus androsaceus JB14]
MKIFGISFGGGQQRPGNFAHTANEDAVWDRLRNTPEVQAVARRVDYLLACYFPKLHNLYTNTLKDLCNADKSLSPNFKDCCFAASSINLDHAVTCAIKNFGTFNYKKGGHLVLWDLKLIIEFPPGCTALLPSAMLAHSNTSIAQREHCQLMTFFTVSGLLRWRHNNYMLDKDFIAGATRSKRQAWEEHRDNLWRTGLDLFSDL